jgi:predicted MFS family arabinose efflux permease
MKHIGYLEISVGIGLVAGPTLGSIIGSMCTYEVTMYVFGVFDTLGLLICCIIIPGELNESASEEDVAGIEQEDLAAMLDDSRKSASKKEAKYNITTWTILTNKHTVFALFTMFLGTFNTAFWTGFISTTLTETYDLHEDMIGYVWASQSLTYLAACLLLPYTCESMPRKLQFVIGVFGMGGCLLLLGPS